MVTCGFLKSNIIGYYNYIANLHLRAILSQ